jgi:hypothetical protein
VLEPLEPHLLVEPISSKRAFLPRFYLELAGLHRLLHVDAYVGEPPEMLVSSLGVDEVERPIPFVEAVLDERPKHAVLLVDAVEERANVATLAESVRRSP